MLVTPQFSYLISPFIFPEIRDYARPELWWKGMEDLSLSLIGGVSLMLCLLSWLGRRIRLVPVWARFIRECYSAKVWPP